MMVSDMTGGRRVEDESDEDASEAQAQVIASLRGQVTDLFSQVVQLNSKLVSSYDRMSDLEDQLHEASSSLRNASLTISSLELERSHHLAALNTGLLVEKAHVTAELNRLMERATEEAAQRGQAETARRDIEKDLDDLSASLFDQANTMVAEARLNQARSERKVQEAEQALRIAEDAVKDMQIQMQSLQAAKEAAERDTQEANVAMHKGKWVERDDLLRVGDVPRARFMTMQSPYTEFIAFVAHLRGLRLTQSTPPVISTVLSQPFIARLLSEDSEPTVRLDLAPSLNWLSRRSVLTAIHTGMLTVEPWPFSTFVQELHQHPQAMASSTLSCALCGTFIARLPSTGSVPRVNNTNGSSWFKYPLALGAGQNHDAGIPSADREPPDQIYIFRLAATASTPPPTLSPLHTSSLSMPAVGTSSRPPLNTITSSRVLPAQTQNSPYPLCASNYCLTRLRSTCSLWAFVRVGIMERIWEEAVILPPKSHVNGAIRETPSALASAGSQPPNSTTLPSAFDNKPPVPPRRRRLWEMASALGERAVSWGKESGEATREREKENDGAKKLPNPPPSHPLALHSHSESFTSRVDVTVPPPLPKRNVIHNQATSDILVDLSGTQNEIVILETNDTAVKANGHFDPDKAHPSPSDSPSTSIEEITFAAPPSPLPATTSHPVSVEGGASAIGDNLPPSPHNDPLPTTPTMPTPISRVTSPVSRPRSRLSSPASPPPSSRPASPAVSRSRAGSPTPTGVARPTSPVPRYPPSVSHIRGKPSLLSPLASARPASPGPPPGSGAPPVPRRAAARRTVPPPPPVPSDAKVTGEVSKEEAVSTTIVAPVDLTLEIRVPKSGEVETASDGETGDETHDVAVPSPTLPGPAKDVPACNAERQLNGTSADVPSDSFSASEGNGRASIETTSTKQPSSTEGEGFAGDTTWEDRTWKELMKLKEDMFWARIGGIRALQGDQPR